MKRELLKDLKEVGKGRAGRREEVSNFTYPSCQLLLSGIPQRRHCPRWSLCTPKSSSRGALSLSLFKIDLKRSCTVRAGRKTHQRLTPGFTMTQHQRLSVLGTQSEKGVPGRGGEIINIYMKKFKKRNNQ